MGGPIVLLYGARHPGHAAGLIVQSGFARWDPPRLVEGFRRVAGDEVAEIARRSFAGEDVPDEEWARVAAAFGPRVPDEEQRACTPTNHELNAHGMGLVRRLDGAGHFTWMDAPDRFWAMIIEFINASTRSERGRHERRNGLT